MNRVIGSKCILAVDGDMKKIALTLSLFVLGISAVARAETAQKVEYVPVTVQSVSSALFRAGVLRTDDPAAVEEYIRIHTCGIYEKYVPNDFTWTRIREAQGREIEINLQSMPNAFEVVSTVPLGEYDMTNNAFRVIQEAQATSVGILTVLELDDGSYFPCQGEGFDPFVPRVHPLKLDVKLDTKISVTEIPISKEKADQFLNLIKTRKARTEQQKRYAMMAMRVRLLGADPLSSVTNSSARTVLGVLDEVRVYEGPERKLLMYQKDYQSLRTKTPKTQ